MGIIIEVNYGRDEVEGGYYHPNIAPERLTLGLLLETIDHYGSEVLRLKLTGAHAAAWQARAQAYSGLRERSDLLLRDLI